MTLEHFSTVPIQTRNVLTLPLLLFIAAAFVAGIANTLAGGGSFFTFPALLFMGLDARAANITSTLALFPMQLSAGYAGRKHAEGLPHLPFRALFAISLVGGAIGAALLLLTPSAFFARLVPWLILLATGLFAWGSFFKKPRQAQGSHRLHVLTAALIQFLIAVYGGYFGGGIGFLMLAALTLAGMSIRAANATKIILASAMNGMAVIIFAFSKDIGWVQVVTGGIASVLGSLVGVHLLNKVNERVLRGGIVVFGLALTIGLFLRG